MTTPDDTPPEATELPTDTLPPAIEEWRERVVKIALFQGQPFAEDFVPPAALFLEGKTPFEAVEILKAATPDA